MNFYQLNMLYRAARNYGHARIRNAGVTDTEHQICTFLHFHEEISQDDVAGGLQLDKTTVARALASLESKGMIQRVPNPQNRRKNILSLTDAGRSGIADVIHVYDEWMERVCGCLSAQEQEAFDQMVQRMRVCAENILQEEQL